MSHPFPKIMIGKICTKVILKCGFILKYRIQTYNDNMVNVLLSIKRKDNHILNTAKSSVTHIL